MNTYFGNYPTFSAFKHKLTPFFKNGKYGFQTQISINSKKDYLNALFILKACNAICGNPQPWRSRIKTISAIYSGHEQRALIYYFHTFEDTINWPLKDFIEKYIPEMEEIHKFKNLI